MLVGEADRWQRPIDAVLSLHENIAAAILLFPAGHAVELVNVALYVFVACSDRGILVLDLFFFSIRRTAASPERNKSFEKIDETFALMFVLLRIAPPSLSLSFLIAHHNRFLFTRSRFYEVAQVNRKTTPICERIHDLIVFLIEVDHRARVVGLTEAVLGLRRRWRGMQRHVRSLLAGCRVRWRHGWRCLLG